MGFFDDDQTDEYTDQSSNETSSPNNAARNARDIYRRLSEKNKGANNANTGTGNTGNNTSSNPNNDSTNTTGANDNADKNVPPASSGSSTSSGNTAEESACGVGGNTATESAAGTASETAPGGTAATGGTAVAETAAGGAAAGETAAGGAAAGGAAASGAAAGGAAAGGAAAGGAAAAPIIAIVLAALLLIFLIAAFVVILTPENAAETAGKYIRSKVESFVEYAEYVSDFFLQVFGIKETIVPIEADESEYDKDNEFDVGLITNYNAINTALNADYNKFINSYLKDYCSTYGYSYKKTVKELEKKYPNGWRDIYADVNYGEFINILALGYKAGAYGPNVDRGDTNALSDFLMNEDNWPIFFKINVSSPAPSVPPESSGDSNDNGTTETDGGQTEIEDDGSPYTILSLDDSLPIVDKKIHFSDRYICSIILTPSTTLITDLVNDSENKDSQSETSTENTQSQTTTQKVFNVEEDGDPADISIYPFCMKELFEALKIDKDADYHEGVTYYEMLELMKSQDIAICEDPAGGYRVIYYTLRLDKPSATWDYGFSSVTVSGIFSDIGLLPVTGDNPAIVWQYLKAAGFTDEGAAGVMGNLMAEHGFNTSMEGEGGSVGIVQWTGGRKDSLTSYASGMGLSVTDIHAQASFMTSELNSTKYDCMRNATDVISAADYTAYYYEACSRYSSYDAYLSGKYAGVISWSRYSYSDVMNTYIIDLDKRRSFAQYYYDMYKGTY